jgi:ArsR family transcriptional regulator
MQEAVDFLKALAHPLRLRISLGLCHKGECHVNEMAGKLDVAQSAVSHQLGILRKAGVVTFHREGPSVCYHISTPSAKKLIREIGKQFDIAGSDHFN